MVAKMEVAMVGCLLWMVPVNFITSFFAKIGNLFYEAAKLEFKKNVQGLFAKEIHQPGGGSCWVFDKVSFVLDARVALNQHPTKSIY
jgi:hypothetical protein